jgi:hypothetical protein
VGTIYSSKESHSLAGRMRITLEQDTEGYVLFLANTLGWTRGEITFYLARFRSEVKSGLHHAYHKQKVVWGRKPEKTPWVSWLPSLHAQRSGKRLDD